MSDYDKLSDDVIDLMIAKRGKVERYSHEIYAMARELRERRDAEHTFEAHDGPSALQSQDGPPLYAIRTCQYCGREFDSLVSRDAHESACKTPPPASDRADAFNYADFVKRFQDKLGIRSGAIEEQPHSLSGTLYSEDFAKALRTRMHPVDTTALKLKLGLHSSPAPLTAVSCASGYPKGGIDFATAGGDIGVSRMAADPDACTCVPQTKGRCSMCGGWGPV